MWPWLDHDESALRNAVKDAVVTHRRHSDTAVRYRNGKTSARSQSTIATAMSA